MKVFKELVLGTLAALYFGAAIVCTFLIFAEYFGK